MRNTILFLFIIDLAVARLFGTTARRYFAAIVLLCLERLKKERSPNDAAETARSRA
ncbi:MAG TPA: hypothetical protein VIG90_01480 [Pedomonas sp.]|uniref:hypothetical protein n=1 Tax=Pedomonas sp. TaxID=2976421 RepID=UPI002F4020D4